MYARLRVTYGFFKLSLRSDFEFEILKVMNQKYEYLWEASCLQNNLYKRAKKSHLPTRGVGDGLGEGGPPARPERPRGGERAVPEGRGRRGRPVGVAGLGELRHGGLGGRGAAGRIGRGEAGGQAEGKNGSGEGAHLGGNGKET